MPGTKSKKAPKAAKKPAGFSRAALEKHAREHAAMAKLGLGKKGAKSRAAAKKKRK